MYIYFIKNNYNVYASLIFLYFRSSKGNLSVVNDLRGGGDWTETLMSGSIPNY